MKIPADAIIAEEKLTRYLLVWRPRKDKSKWLARAGFTIDNPGDLEKAIRDLIAENEAFFDRNESFGDFYRVEGNLTGTQGRSLGAVSVWIVKTGESVFRFVTMKPGKKVKS